MCHPGATQPPWRASPSNAAHCPGYGRAAAPLHNRSLPADVGLAPSKPSPVRCPLPLKVLTHQAVPLANPVQRPHTRLYLITQVKTRVLMLFIPKVQIWGCVGTGDLPLHQSHWKATYHRHSAASYPEEHMRNTSTPIEQERFSWEICKVNLPVKLSVPPKAVSCKH